MSRVCVWVKKHCGWWSSPPISWESCNPRFDHGTCRRDLLSAWGSAYCCFETQQPHLFKWEHGLMDWDYQSMCLLLGMKLFWTKAAVRMQKSSEASDLMDHEGITRHFLKTTNYQHMILVTYWLHTHHVVWYWLTHYIIYITYIYIYIYIYIIYIYII